MFDEEAETPLRGRLPNSSYVVFILVVGVMAGLIAWSLISSGRTRAAAEDLDTRGQLQTELRALVGAPALPPAVASPVATYGAPQARTVSDLSWKWLGFIGLVGVVITLWATINYYVTSTVEIEDEEDSSPAAPAEAPRAPLMVVPEWMKIAVRASRDGIIGLDSTGRITVANPAAEKLLGCESGKLPSQKATDYLPGIGQNPDELRRFSQVASAAPVTANRKDGTSEPLRLALQRVGEKGETHYVAMFYKPEAAPAVDPVAAPAVPVAEAAAAPAPVAPAVVAPAFNEDALHDLENQVVMMSGYSELVVAALDEEHPARPDAEAVSRSAARASLLCHEVAPITQPHGQMVDLNQFVEAIAGPLSRVLDEGCEITGCRAQTAVEVWADPDLLERSVCSLAWRTQELSGGLKHVSIAVANGRLDLRLTPAGAAPAATPAAFDALHAVDWIEALNGTIEMEERSTAGVRFRIWLPAAAQPRQPRVTEAIAGEGASTSRRHAAAD